MEERGSLGVPGVVVRRVVVNARQAVAAMIRAGPSGFVESRTATMPGRPGRLWATSTQLPALPLNDALRQVAPARATSTQLSAALWDDLRQVTPTRATSTQLVLVL